MRVISLWYCIRVVRFSSFPMRSSIKATRSAIIKPRDLIHLPVERTVLRELESLHRSLIAMHLEREPKSIKVLKEITRS